LRAITPELWDRRAALGEWSTRELAAHTLRAFVTIEGYLAAPPATDRVLADAAEYYATALSDPTAHQGVAARARQAGRQLIDPVGEAEATIERVLAQIAPRPMTNRSTRSRARSRWPSTWPPEWWRWCAHARSAASHRQRAELHPDTAAVVLSVLIQPRRRCRSSWPHRSCSVARQLQRWADMPASSMLRQALRAADVPPFHAMAMARRAGEVEARGQRVFHLEVGQPATGAPAAARAAVVAAMERADPLGYTNAPGSMALRRRICRHYAEAYGVEVATDDVIVVAGASAGFTLAFLAAFDAGDRVGVLEPGYPCYRNALLALGVEPVAIPVGPDTRWAPTPELLAAAGELDGWYRLRPIPRARCCRPTWQRWCSGARPTTCS
jgi:hypothetical protein